jgi:cytochrome c oxidase subunit 2
MCVLISVFVLGLLLWVVFRYNAKANPVPSRTTHNVPLEIIWTIVPVIILIIIAVPSFKHLFYLGKTPETEMTLKVTGYQWYWGYEYPDHEGLAFESRMIEDKNIDESKGQRRLLSTDNVVYLPTDTNIQIIVTAADVLHSFTVPAFGIKKDAVPGRLNETWVRIDKPGTYFGQCSEICGTGHAYMPIEVRAVPKEEFAAWIEKAKKEFAQNNYQPLQMAFVKDIQ